MIKSSVKYIALVLVTLLLNPIVAAAQCGTITTSNSIPLCQNEPVTFTAETNATVLYWSTSTSTDFNEGLISNIINNDSTSITFPEGFTETTYIRVHLLLCSDLVLEAPVVEPIIDNTISTQTENIDCNTAPPIIINGSVSGPPANEEQEEEDSTSTNLHEYHWQISYTGEFWLNIPASNSANLSMTQLPDHSIYLRRLVETAGCETDTSNTLFIEFFAAPDGGLISGGGNYCFNEQPSLTLTDYTGTISHWESSNDNSSFSIIGGTEGLETFEPSGVVGPRYYRVLLSNPGCESAYSDTVHVHTQQEFLNIIESEDQYYCGAQVPSPITANSLMDAGIEISILWQQKTLFESEWVNLQNALYVDNNLHLEQPINETMMFRRVVATENCGYFTSDTAMVYIQSPSLAGQFSNPTNNQTVCSYDNIETIILEGFQGSIIDWFMAPSANGPWESFNHTDSVYTPNYAELNETTYYRVLVQSGSCESVLSEVYSVSLYHEIEDNEISESQEICDGSTPSTLIGSMPQGGSGVFTFQWQQRTNTTDWENILENGTSVNYTPPQLNTTHYYRRIASSTICLSDTSDQVAVEIFESPTGWISAENYICPEEPASLTVHLDGSPPFSIIYSDGVEIYSQEEINTNEYTLAINPESSTTYSLLSVSDANCDLGAILEPSSVNVLPVPLLASVSAGEDVDVCGSTYTLSGSDYDPEFYEAIWFNESGEEIGNGQEITIETQTPGSFGYTYQISSTHCPALKSADVILTFDFPETADAGEDIVLCQDSAVMNANEINWGVGYWNIPESLEVNDPFNSQAVISNLINGENYDVAWIALSLMEVCPADTSWINISVDAISDAGDLNASTTQICQGNEVSFQLSNQQGTVTEWMFDYETGLENIDSDVTQIETQFNSSAGVSVVVKSGVCPADTTEWITITVDSLLSAGTLTTDEEQVCIGSNSGTLQLTDYSGQIEFWEMSTNNFATSETINTTLDSYVFENLSTTSQFRTKVEAGECGSEFSNAVTVEVLPQIDYTFELDEQYCSDAASVDLSELISESNGGVWMINGTEHSTFDPSLYGNSIVEITYVNSTGCGGSSTATTSVTESPVVWTSGNEQVCGLETTIEAGNSTGTGHWAPLSNIELSANSGTQVIQAPDFGNYNVMWTAENDGCFSQETITLEFYDNPTEAEAGNDQQLELTDRAELSANTPSTGVGTWYSNDNDLSFTDLHSPVTMVNQLKIGENEVFWKISNGACPESVSKVVIEVLPMHVPNAFSPNGDGVNDLFRISGLDAVSPVDIKVWNRWGAEVFTSKNYDNTWNGEHLNGNELPSDTYYYSIETPASPKTLKGFILLQR